MNREKELRMRRILFAAFMISLLYFPTNYAIASNGLPDITAPNIDRLVFSLGKARYADWESLTNGEINMIPTVWTLEDYANMSSRTSIETYTSLNGTKSMACLFFNSRRSPFNNTAVRLAFSSLCDREYITSKLLHGLARPQQTFIPESSNDWLNKNAKASDSNPFYTMYRLMQAGYSYDNNTGSWIDPATGSLLRELTILTPQYSEAEGLWIAGDYISWYMSDFGIPVRHMALAETDLVRVLGQRDFDMCIYNLNFDDGPFGLRGLLYSSLDNVNTTAICGTRDQQLDQALEGLWSGVTRSDAVEGAKAAQLRIADLVPYVPLYSISRITAVSNAWEGLVNAAGVGVSNTYTYSSVHKRGEQYGGSFVVAAEGNITSLNPITANSVSTLNALRLLFSPLIEEDPVTLKETPALATEWQTQPWTTDSGNKGMKITFTLRDDVLWQDGVPFNSSDVKFCIDYLKSTKIGIYADDLASTVKVEAPDRKTVEIYLNSTGYRFVSVFSGMTFLPKHIWVNVNNPTTFKPWSTTNPLVGDMTCLVGQGPFMFNEFKPDEYVKLVWNPLYFEENAQKPGLIAKSPAPETVNQGDTVTFSYEVKDFDGDVRSSPEDMYKFTVNKVNGGIVAELRANLTKGRYEVKVETSMLPSGEYSCRFIAQPYGIVDSTLVVGQTPVTGSQGEIPAFPTTATLVGLALTISLMLVRKHGRYGMR